MFDKESVTRVRIIIENSKGTHELSMEKLEEFKIELRRDEPRWISCEGVYRMVDLHDPQFELTMNLRGAMPTGGR